MGSYIFSTKNLICCYNCCTIYNYIWIINDYIWIIYDYIWIINDYIKANYDYIWSENIDFDYNFFKYDKIIIKSCCFSFIKNDNRG